MTPERFRRVDQLVSLALERPANERAEFLREACAGEEDLRIEVESLLTSQDNEDGFLAEAPARLAAELLEEKAEQEIGELSPAVPSEDRATEPSVDAPAEELKPGSPLGRYVVRAWLGAGGMGVVYLADDPELNRKIAIKLMRPGVSGNISAPEGRARLMREAQAMAQLSHPNVIAVFDVGTFGDQVFIAMEYVEGGTLTNWLAEQERSWREIVNLFVQTGRGLAAAHTASILHRDFKPDNVLVGKDGRPRVLDFGLARALFGEAEKRAPDDERSAADASSLSNFAPLRVALTEPGRVMGTLPYMAPEQLMGQGADHRTDQYSFCVALYQGLYGELPFNAENLGALLEQIQQRRVNKALKSKNLPASLRQVLRCGLSPNPAERFPSMEALLDKLERQLVVRRRRTIKLGADADRSIAVLPFASFSTSEEDAYFARGFHDELLRHLGRIGDLRVISRTSVLQYKEGKRNLREIAEELNVSSIVEGSVQRAGHRVRIEATLIDARSDRELWAERFDRDLTDIFAIQTALAEEIASALHARLTSAQKAQIEREPTQSPEAYDLYLQALEYRRRPGPEPRNLEIAEELYRKAIQIDPSFALARAGLAEARMATFYYAKGASQDITEEARTEAERSLELQPDLPEGHLALGLYHYWGRYDYEQALKELEMARQGAPAEAVGFIAAVERRQGRFDDAIRDMREAIRLDPRSAAKLCVLGEGLAQIRQYEHADRVLERALLIEPEYIAASALKAWLHEAWKGDTDLAKAVLHSTKGRLDPSGRLGQQINLFRLAEHNPREALPFLDSVVSESLSGWDAVYPKAFFYGLAHQALGDMAPAQRAYEAALPLLEAEIRKNPGNPFQLTSLARTYAGLGRKQDALREARRAVEMLPISKDALAGPVVEHLQALVEASVGETEAAMEHIRHLLSIPSWLSPALLRIEPGWAPLRNDPRFRKLAELDRA